jgi:hypothetical protein
VANIASLELLAVEFRAAGPKAVARAKIVLKKTAFDIERNAKAIVPVDFGDLRDSIGHSDMRVISASNMAVEVGPTMDYGGYVEHGTSRMAPQAYMGPSLDRFAGPFEQAMQQIGLEAAGG